MINTIRNYLNIRRANKQLKAFKETYPLSCEAKGNLIFQVGIDPNPENTYIEKMPNGHYKLWATWVDKPLDINECQDIRDDLERMAVTKYGFAQCRISIHCKGPKPLDNLTKENS